MGSSNVYGGLDLATHTSGWTVGDGEALPQIGHWTWEPTGDDLGRLVDLFDQDFNRLLDRFPGLSHLAFEGPLLVVHQRGKKARINPHRFMRKIDAVVGHLEWLCLRHGIWCREVDPMKVKKALAGFSGADKNDQVAAAEKIGLSLTPGKAKDDEADSFGVWLALVRDRNRDLGMRWDRLLYGRRGALL